MLANDLLRLRDYLNKEGIAFRQDTHNIIALLDPLDQAVHVLEKDNFSKLFKIYGTFRTIPSKHSQFDRRVVYTRGQQLDAKPKRIGITRM